jgi:hypothetical protein
MGVRANQRNQYANRRMRERLVGATSCGDAALAALENCSSVLGADPPLDPFLDVSE